MAGIVVLTVFARVLDAVVGKKIERRWMKWQPKVGETEKSASDRVAAELAAGHRGRFIL
jgi:hypothetical protein